MNDERRARIERRRRARRDVRLMLIAAERLGVTWRLLDPDGVLYELNRADTQTVRNYGKALAESGRPGEAARVYRKFLRGKNKDDNDRAKAFGPSKKRDDSSTWPSWLPSAACHALSGSLP